MQLSCTPDTERVLAVAGDMFAPAHVSITVEKRLLPEPHADNEPEMMVIIDISITDSGPALGDLDFHEVLSHLANFYPDPVYCMHFGHVTAPVDDATLSVPLPIDLWNTGPISTLVGGRFKLALPEIEHGHLILDTDEEEVSATLSIHKDRVLTPSIVQEGWSFLRDIYDQTLAPNPQAGDSNGH